MARPARPLALIGALSLVVAACGSGGPPATSTTAGATPTMSVTATPTEPTPTGPSPLAICHDGAHCAISPGDYVTPAPEGFWPGITFSIGSGWFATEADSGELALHPSAQSTDALLFWKDVVATRSSTGGNGIGGITAVEGVGTTPEELLGYFTSNTDYEVLSGPDAATTGGGLTGTVITMTTSDTANFGDPDCPDDPHCSAFLRDPVHWGTEFFAIGGDEVVRMFLTSFAAEPKPHTLVIALDAPNQTELERFAAEAKPIIDSVVLPETFVDN
jgi:hypothetical protein